MQPITVAPLAAIKTAPAATSLAFPIKGWYSEVTMSLSISSAVFSPSATQTDIMDKTRNIHSS